MIPKQEVRKQEVRMFGNTMEMLGNETSNIAAIAHGNENPGGFVRNMFCNGFTNSVEEASDEFEEDCINRKHVVGRIVLENICEVHWMFGFVGE